MKLDFAQSESTDQVAYQQKVIALVEVLASPTEIEVKSSTPSRCACSTIKTNQVAFPNKLNKGVYKLKSAQLCSM